MAMRVSLFVTCFNDTLFPHTGRAVVSLRELDVGDRPFRLLRAVRGIELVELPDAEECCGFGGTFAIKNAEVSSAILADKVRAVLDTRAEVVCAADNYFLIHIGGALSRQRTGVRTAHLAEVLAS